MGGGGVNTIRTNLSYKLKMYKIFLISCRFYKIAIRIIQIKKVQNVNETVINFILITAFYQKFKKIVMFYGASHVWSLTSWPPAVSVEIDNCETGGLSSK